MLRFFFSLLATFFLISFGSAAALASEPYNFNPGWRLLVGDSAGASAPAFDDSAWQPITLPHAWNEDAAFRVSIDQLPTGIAWYRKKFVLPAPATPATKKIFLEFEGARQAAELWLNGKYLGAHENGITAFGFDITDFVQPAPAENVLAVRTDNAWDYREKLSGARFQWSDKNFNANYGGLPKNVRLHVTDRVYQTLPLYSHLGTTGVYVYATDFDIPARTATVHAESEIRNDDIKPRTFLYRVSITPADVGRGLRTPPQTPPLATFDGGTYTLAPRESVTARASARVADLHFWSWGYGYLYTVTTSLVSAPATATSSAPSPTAAVFDSVTTHTGFRKTEFAHGLVTLNDRVLQLKGYAQRTSNEWPALGLSVPPWLSDYSNGLMVESGASLVRWMHITPWKQDVESCDRVGLMQMMPAGDSEKDAQGRPWVARTEVMRDAIIYNRNNPSILVYESGNNGISEAHMAEMKAIRDRFDPHGGRAIGARDMLGSRVAEYGGEMLYVNKSARTPFWQSEYSRDEGLRKYWDDFSPPFHQDGDGPLYRNAPAREYNRNQDSHAIEDVLRWYDFWRERPGTGTRVNSGGVNIIFSDTNTHFRGAENYRRSGEVDAMRIPKDGFYAHQVMWDAWVDIEKPRIHLLGHWNYAPGVVKPVTAVSTADSVELFLNGRSLGRGRQSARFLFSFPNVAWEPGTLTAVGYDASGQKVCETSHVTAGAPAALKLTAVPRPTPLLADGADVALLQIEVVDAQGRRCPTALDTVDFALAGPAEWRGGLAQGPGNFILSKTLPVECGVNRVLVRTTTEPGEIAVTAKSGTLAPARLAFTSQPFPVTAGLTPHFPAGDLPSPLTRGPTPAGPSFHVSSISIPVASVSATDGNDPALACDDDETTAWSGRQPIRFTLARPAKLDEIVAKFAGFRARSYPLRIDVDGHEVFRGVTPRSLGYVHLPLTPALAGRVVTLTILGGAEARDAFGAVSELVDQKNATTGEEKVGAGELGLLEIEFHAAPSP